MGTRETISAVVELATPMLIAGLGFFFAWSRRKLEEATQNQRLAQAMDLLAHGAQGIVADLSQHVVADLKDPNKPGTWDDVSKEAVRSTAISRLRSLYPQAVAVLGQQNAQKVAEILGTLVEAAVLKFKRP